MVDLHIPKSTNEQLFRQTLARKSVRQMEASTSPLADVGIMRGLASAGGAGNDGGPDEGDPMPAAMRVTNVPAIDWNVLFRAVIARLRLTASGAVLATTRDGDTVLECLNALNLLQAALTQERSRHRQLEKDLLVAKTSLSQLRVVQEFRLALVNEQHVGHIARPGP